MVVAEDQSVRQYDSVDRTLLWTVLARFGVLQNMISVIRQFHDSMRATRRQSVFGVVRLGTGPSSRARAHALPVQYHLRGGYKRRVSRRTKTSWTLLKI